jgi:cysteine desulfurase
VLQAIGLEPEAARATLRIGMGRFTSPADAELAAASLAASWHRAVSATDKASD